MSKINDGGPAFPESGPRGQAVGGEDIMVNTPYDVFILPLSPSGLPGGPRFVVHVPGPEQPAAVFRNDGNTEADFITHEANACTACGGSGHKADQQPDAGLDVEAVLRRFLTGDGFIAECDIRHIVAALTPQPVISGYTCTVPDDCETLHWRGQILSMNELASVVRPKRRPYNASGSLSEYGVFPECDVTLAQQPAEQHPDDAAVDRFAAAMKAKLKKKRQEGRGGWQSMTSEQLSALLHEHVRKGDPVDVANLAMMLHQNGQVIEPPATVVTDEMVEALRAEVERLQEIVRPKREDECLTLDHWRMRAYALEANWARCSHACACEQDKREQAEARAERLAEALRDAATSMQTIADKAGRDEYLMTTDEVRGYANSRANAARAALNQEEGK